MNTVTVRPPQRRVGTCGPNTSSPNTVPSMSTNITTAAPTHAQTSAFDQNRRNSDTATIAANNDSIVAGRQRNS